MKKLLFILAFIPSLIFGQATVNLSPDSTLHELHIVTTATSYCDEYQAVHDKWITLGVPASTTDASKYNTLVVNWVANDSAWYDHDAIGVFAVHDSTASLVNWRDTSKAFTVTGAATWDQYQGFNGDGSTAGINTGYNPTDGTNYTQNSASFGVYNRASDVTAALMGVEQGGVYTAIYGQYTSINSGSQSGFSLSDNSGLYALERKIAGESIVVRNGVFIDTLAHVSAGVPDLPFYVLCRNDNSVLKAFATTAEISMFFGGGSLTETQHLNVFGDFEEFMSGL